MSGEDPSEMRASVGDFLDRLAARAATPGGGSAAALAGAVGCALGRMVAEYSVGKPGVAAGRTIETLGGQLERADQMMRRLIDEDAVAYAALVEARRAAKTNGDKQVEFQAAVEVAAMVPLEIAAVAAAAMDALRQLEAAANPHLLSDLRAATEILAGTARAAAHMVTVNLGDIADQGRRDQIRAQLDSILRHVAERAQKTSPEC